MTRKTLRLPLFSALLFGSAAWIASAELPVPAADAIPGFHKLSAETDWPWWRGPSRSGIAPSSAAPPITWSETENIVWKTPVPGRGHSSPTVIGNRVYLETADERAQVQSVLAFDRSTGKQVWKTDISRGGFPRTHPKNSHATPTIAGDGERLFAAFHHHDRLQAVALDAEGKIVWNRSLGEFHPTRFEYGYAPSPVVYRDSVIIAAEYDGDSFIAALRREDGGQLWRTPRPNNITFSTPSIGTIGGRDLLAISGDDRIACYDPASGRPLWSVEATTAATCGTVVWDGDLLFASGGYPEPGTAAVRVAAGRGQVIWANGQKCYEQSMLAYQGYLYALTDKGVLYCFRGSDGTMMWQKRLRGPVSASPVLAGGHIYWANELGTMYVFQPDPAECRMMSENVLGDEAFASPAVGGNQLFLRVAERTSDGRQEYLYCVGRSQR